MEKTLQEIASKFRGIQYEDLTTLEKQIANILIEQGYLQRTLDEDLVIVKR